jgi:uncharacterized protein YjbI with pentapeptide repeats
VAEFVCGVREKDPNYLFACKNLRQYQDTGYCVLHFPGEKKKEDFEQVKKDKLEQEDYDFSGTFFPEGTSDFNRFVFEARVSFEGAQFSGESTYFAGAQFDGNTSFYGAQFNGDTYFAEAHFSGEWTSFSSAQFSSERTDFSGAQFSGERTDFQQAHFGGAETSFSSAQFSSERTDFSGAQFSSERTNFSEVEFGSAETYFQAGNFTEEVTFSDSIIKEKVVFSGTKANLVFSSQAWAWFNSCRIEKPEMLTFNTMLLRPGWFINTDVSKVDFTNVMWYGMPGGPEGILDEETHALKDRGIDAPYVLLAQAYRRLSANAEENREYPLANEFHYWSLEALRKEGWRSLGLIGTLYWALNGYGVRPVRAFCALVAMWLTFAALYFFLVESSPFWVFSASDIWQGIDYARQAAVYSLSALVRLNPRPQSEELDWFQTLVTIEGILGPLQIALLTLAVRRKVIGLVLPPS